MPRSIVTSHAGMFARDDGTKCGSSRPWSRPATWRVARSIVSNPATAALITTPTRSGSTPEAADQPASSPASATPPATSSPAAATASRVAATANSVQRAERRNRFPWRTASGSKSRTSAAIRTGSSDASNAVIGPTPERPASKAFQVDSRSRPTTGRRRWPRRSRPSSAVPESSTRGRSTLSRRPPAALGGPACARLPPPRRPEAVRRQGRPLPRVPRAARALRHVARLASDDRPRVQRDLAGDNGT